MLCSILLFCGSLNAMQLEKENFQKDFYQIFKEWENLENDWSADFISTPKKEPKKSNNQKEWTEALDNVEAQYGKYIEFFGRLFIISEKLDIDSQSIYPQIIKKKSSKNCDVQSLSEQFYKVKAELPGMRNRVHVLIKMIEKIITE